MSSARPTGMSIVVDPDSAAAAASPSDAPPHATATAAHDEIESGPKTYLRIEATPSMAVCESISVHSLVLPIGRYRRCFAVPPVPFQVFRRCSACTVNGIDDQRDSRIQTHWQSRP